MHTAQGYSLGAVDYILTPVVPEILRTKVRVFVDLYRMTQQVKRQAEERVALAGRRRRGRRPRRRRGARRSWPRRAPSWSARSTTRRSRAGLAGQSVPFLADLCAVTWSTRATRPLADRAGLGRPAGRRGRPHGVGTGPGPRAARGPIRRVLQAGEWEIVPAGRHRPTAGRSAPRRARRRVGDGRAPRGPRHAHRAAVGPRRAALRPRAHASARSRWPSRDGPAPFGPADVGLARDLAGRAAIAIDNARLYRDIQENDRRKNEFLAMLAHELRNPLAPIRNAVEILRMLDIADPNLQWASDVIDRQVEQLVRLVDDLLDISRITGGKIQLRKEPVDVAVAVARAVETSRPLIDARRHELTVDAARRSRCASKADLVRLAQVLSNLLNNAAKYTEEGGRIELERDARGRRGRLPGARQRDRHPAARCSRASSTCSPRSTARSTARRAAWASA